MLHQDWESLASSAQSGALAPDRLAAASKDRVESMLAAMDLLAEYEQLPTKQGDNDNKPAGHPPIKVTVYAKGSNGVMLHCHDLQLSVDLDREATPVKLKVQPDPPSTMLLSIGTALAQAC
jgi:hypothetical protein